MHQKTAGSIPDQHTSLGQPQVRGHTVGKKSVSVCLSLLSLKSKIHSNEDFFNTESQNTWLRERSKTITNLKQYHNFKLERGWTASGHEGSNGGGG